MPAIGELREGPLHAALKAWLAEPGDRLEVPVGRHVIDLVRADGELVEIQTGGFTALGPKLDLLLDSFRVRIVHPIAAERRIIRVDPEGEVLRQSRSPRRGSALDAFHVLVSFPALLSHPNLTVEVLLLREDHLRGPEPVRIRRRTRDPGQRRLVDVLERVELRGPADLLAVVERSFGGPLPSTPFSTRELAAGLRCPIGLAQRIVYCLRAVEVLGEAGHRARAPLWAAAAPAPCPRASTS